MSVRSVLAHMLPEAMLCYLENYPAEKFAQVFLGEFENPEVIWNAEMRCAAFNAHSLVYTLELQL